MNLRILLAASLTLASACNSDPAGTKASPPPPPPAKASTTAPPASEPHHGGAVANSAPTDAATVGYACPMHPEVRSDKPGKCHKCGMDLVAVDPAAVARKYDVVVTTTPPPEAGKKTALSIEVIDDSGARIKDFEVVHEKKLHLLLVSKDLSWFAHEHPELGADGTMKLDFTFPAGGPHTLYADFRPAGASGQVIQKPIDVGGTPRETVALQQDDLTKAKSIAGHKVRMKASSLTAGDSVKLDFFISKGGKPVTNLTPYLGAQGHCVIISQDGSQFLHSHPDDGGGHDHAPGSKPHVDAPTPDKVSFATQFPAAGLYKVWGQFVHDGEMIIAGFVVDVAPGSGKPAADGHGDH